jgi:hypothetical protein
MKNILLVLMIFCTTSCFLDLERYQFADEPQAIVGKWKMVSYTSTKTGKTTVINDTSNTHTFEVRYDGVALDDNGKRMCCVGLDYIQNINGKIYYVKSAEPIPENPRCNLVGCGRTCSPRWTVTGDSLFSEGCYNFNNRYVRVK